uniref:MYND-type domain-containing protein n=1 Tax=Glossina austeni TaxID=7395 RepID=A0A1A9UIY6_GLOAU
MGLNGNDGFFSAYYLNLKNNLKDFDLEVENIKHCRNDLERIEFLNRLSGLQEHDHALNVRRSYEGKNADVAADFKEKGNIAFKAKKWLEAMILYSKSYIALPADKVLEKSIILANRSAALYHLDKYDETLIDIKRSLDYGYPKDTLYKLYERQAKCFLAKKNYPNSIICFKKFLTSMDDATLDEGRRSKMNLDAMTMMKMLEKDPQTAKQTEYQKKNGFAAESVPSLAIRDEKELLSPAVKFDENSNEGRFAKAAADIKVAEEILIEKPFVAALLEKFSKTHCEHCFIRSATPVACPTCADVIYCSEKCLSRAAKSYHKYECGLLSTIWQSGASINCHMALRILASQDKDNLLKLAKNIDQKLSLEEILKLPKTNYLRVAHLVRHESTRTASNWFQHALMARFLSKCLQESSYMDKQCRSEDFAMITSLLLRTLQFLQFNTHEVAELHKSEKDGSERTAFIGGALYPTLALFNHSCDPGVVRYFRGTTIHINTVKPIEAGLPISENYGPIYTQERREERQAKLRDLYRFDCSCDACLENWPTFDELPTDVIRFRCDAPNKCNAIIEISPACNDFMIKCVTCGEMTNIFKGLKVMQDTESMTRTAKHYYEAGEYSKALNKFIDLLKIMHEVLAPPFPDFCQCQQYLKDCLLHFGNFYNLN